MNIGIVSGYFNPLHLGHLNMLIEAKRTYDKVYVIINNDHQQILKKGKIIMNQIDRMKIVALYTNLVDDIIISIDYDKTVCESLKFYASLTNVNKLFFLNGGDRKNKKDIPETKICKEYGIEMVFNVGENKIDSSSRINKARGKE